MGVIAGSAAYFWLASPYNHGVVNKGQGLEIGDYLYFSVITFSSLGYGDILPVGLGRGVAAFEVMAGVTLTAIFVGKVASERQSAILLLLYTSEQQRRIRDFTRDILALQEEIGDALSKDDHGTVAAKGADAFRLLSSMQRYLIFQANQGGLTAFGNDAPLRGLYRAIGALQTRAFNGLVSATAMGGHLNKLRLVVWRSGRIAAAMKPFHSEDNKARITLDKMIKLATELWRRREPMLMEVVLEAVKCALPRPPWPKHVHKTVAARLGISNSRADECIRELVERGVWPELLEKQDQNKLPSPPHQGDAQN